MEGIGGKHGWAWIFILVSLPNDLYACRHLKPPYLQEGLFTFVCGIATFFCMTETPAKASFLTPREKCFVEDVLRRDGVISRDEQDDLFSWEQVRKTFKTPQVLILAVAGFFNGQFCSSLIPTLTELIPKS